MQRTVFSCAVATVLVAVAGQARAEVDPNSGIDLVRVRAVNNPAWQGDGTVGDRAIGRGSVGYEYSIGKFEVTTSQWVEFVNAAANRPASEQLPHIAAPGHWGAVPGASGWTVPAGNEMLPVGNISWRMAAMYCNWLHNDKATNREAFLNGAYDASTFTFTPGGRFRDQQTHNAGARYWIPTWDEWLKAAHYDPNKQNPDGSVGGWWKYSITSDTEPTRGLPGVGQTNTGGGIPNPFGIPLGAYTDVTSPWGLYDVAGATAEWTEEVVVIPGDTFPIDRVYEGSWWVDGGVITDRVGFQGGSGFPSLSTFDLGFRVASSVPSPSAFFLGVTVIALVTVQRRRSHDEEDRVRLGNGPPRSDGSRPNQVHY